MKRHKEQERESWKTKHFELLSSFALSLVINKQNMGRYTPESSVLISH